MKLAGRTAGHSQGAAVQVVGMALDRTEARERTAVPERTARAVGASYMRTRCSVRQSVGLASLTGSCPVEGSGCHGKTSVEK